MNEAAFLAAFLFGGAMKILIDPGHGGTDPGAVNGETGHRESIIAFQYAMDLWPALAARKYAVELTRKSDVFVSLQERVRIAREWKADLFLSIHLNSAENPLATGFEVWTSIGQTRSDDCATALWYRIRQEFPALAPRADWGDKDPDREANYYVLKNTPMPAVLVELGFICNAGEARWLAETTTRQRYVLAIGEGICAWSG
jgi:N-acetylmuramoyl-L-alanine amidase